MSDAFDLLARRRAREAANPGKTYRQLNEQYLKDNNLPVTKPTFGGVTKDYSEQEATNMAREHQYKKIELYNKMKSCGESQIGRNAKCGKHGTFMELDKPDTPTETPTFASPAEKSRYLYEQNRKRLVDDAITTKMINSVTSHHILHQVVDQHSIAGRTIEEVGKTSAAVNIVDAKEHLVETHKKLHNDAGYKAVAAVRKLRVLDESEEGELGFQHENALNHVLCDNASEVRTQENLEDV